MTIGKDQIALGFLQLIGLLFPFLLGIVRLYISEGKEPNPPDAGDREVSIQIIAPKAVRWIIVAILILLLSAGTATAHLLTQLWMDSLLLSFTVILLFVTFAILGYVAFRILLDYFSITFV